MRNYSIFCGNRPVDSDGFESLCSLQLHLSFKAHADVAPIRRTNGFALPAVVHAATRVQAVAVPDEMRSSAFTVKVDGHPADVAHAAASYEFVSFDITGPVTVEITASQAGFWDKGVDIQPWRLGLRAIRQGPTIRFKLTGPAKLSISRPGDFLNHAAML